MELETEQKLQYIDRHTYGRQRCVFLVLRMLNRRPSGPLCWVMAFFTASYQHLINNFSGPQLNRGPRAPSAWCGFTYYFSYLSVSNSNWNSLISLLTELYNSPRPLSHILNFWNCMLDRYQAEITVMKFTGRSLPVHQSMSVPWGFFLPRPISWANFRPRDFLS